MPTISPLPLIDLFAGCGGFSLGLEQAGFIPVYVSELNQHAMDSYLINRQHLDIDREASTCNDLQSVTRSPSRLRDISRRLRRDYDDIALLVGGPPCQGYSSRGIRATFTDIQRLDVPSNHLYMDMARMIESVGPKIFVFENVAGLTTARWTKDGCQGEILCDVQRAFEQISFRAGNRNIRYRMERVLIRARDFGVPQNRPRLFIIGVRDDIFRRWVTNSETESFLPQPPMLRPPDPIDLLGDLIDPNGERRGVSEHYPKAATTKIQRHLRRMPGSENISRKGAPLREQEYTAHAPEVVERFKRLIQDPEQLPSSMRIKKFSQRPLPARWAPNGPNVTVTSAPDDYIHFSRPRILTVREWARLQMFPDWYQFCGPRTTGGRRRAGDPSIGDWTRELPKYTQIGNAVPVSLANLIGQHLRRILD